MDYHFTYELIPELENEINSFYHSIEHVTLEQYPAWAIMEKGNFSNCFFIARDNGRIVCSAVIMERKSWLFRFAIIQFGPLFKEPEVLISSLVSISSYYKGKGYVFLSVQLAIPTGNITDLIEYRLHLALNIQTYFNRENWSSIVLNLRGTEEDIRRNFSKGHKSDLKKAEKNQISVSALSSEEELDRFSKVYFKMNKGRGLAIDEQQSKAFLKRTWEFLKQTGLGDCLIVKDGTSQLLGGIILLYQGKTVRYFKGASDPEYRHLPILHLAIWEGIKRAKTLGFHDFDFWGYNHFVNEKDQVFYINRFKKGFGGSYSFYPKKMYILFKPMMYRLYRTLIDFKKKWNR
jgi:peptidoglycan pentaglycine glycine transferase (the first glycine)